MKFYLVFALSCSFISLGTLAQKYPGICKEVRTDNYGTMTTIHNYDSRNRLWREDIIDKEDKAHKLFRSYTYRYNNKNQVSEYRDIIRGKLSSITTYQYNEDGKETLRESRFFSEDRDGQEFWSQRQASTYDNQGKILKNTTIKYGPNFQNPRPFRDIEYDWTDENNVTVKYFLYDDSGERKLSSYEKNRYVDGNKVEKISYEANRETVQVGNISYRTVLQYNEYNDVISSNSFNPEGVLEMKIINTYDERGNIIEVKSHFEGRGISNRSLVKYDYSCWEE